MLWLSAFCLVVKREIIFVASITFDFFLSIDFIVCISYSCKNSVVTGFLPC